MGYTTSFLYDAADQRIAVQDALGFVWTSTYDDLGRLQNKINPLGHIVSLAYDAVGQIIGNIDANGNITSNTYDGAGQVISTMDALGYQTSLTYDASGRLIGVEDANGHRTTNVYDARGSLLERIDPLNRSVSYSYDAVVNTILRLDPRGILTTYSYDALNRISGVLYPDGGSITNTFDAAGQLTQMADRTGVTSYLYDAVGRQTNVAYPVGKVLSYSYDGTGNRTKMQQGDSITNYNHDPNNNLTQIVNPYNETTTFSYDALDREKQKTLANGVTIDSTYDAAGRKVLLEQRTADTTALAIYTATYDAAGMQTSTLELDGSITSYSYDATYQILTETRAGTNAFSTTFTYDPTGNRLTQNADGTLTTSTYDAANQLLMATTNDEVTSFTSDANGNRIAENVNGVLTTYTWDEENRLIGADDGTNADSFIYAGNGQRRKKSTSTQDINYLWDGNNILEELDDSDNLIAHYTGFPGYWGGLSSLAQPGSTPAPAPATAGMGAFNAVQFNQALFNQSSSDVTTESHFYLFDLQASNRLLLDATATTDNEYLYKAFGEKVLSTETIRNPFQFQGQAGPYFDADKRTQMGARIVDPTVGKWFSPDPIGFVGGDWNLYRFVGNNPANFIDPSGLSCFCCKFYFAFAWCCDDSCFNSPPIFLPKGNSYPGFGPWNDAAPGGGGASQQWPLCSQSFAGGDNYPINWTDPLGLGPFDSYWSQVGQVFKGYGDVLNPLQWYQGAKTIVNIGQQHGAMAAIDAFALGVYHGLTDWTTTTDARHFGQSFGTTLLTVAPFIKEIPNPTGIALEGPWRTPEGGPFTGVTLLKVSRANKQVFRLDVGELDTTNSMPPEMIGKVKPHLHRRGPGGIGKQYPYDSATRGWKPPWWSK